MYTEQDKARRHAWEQIVVQLSQGSRHLYGDSSERCSSE
jgi:hypothetical protein